MTLSAILYVVSAILMLGLGLSMLFAPARYQRDRTADYDRRLADRLARGEDAYFEELRTIEAYRRPFDLRGIRFFGAVLAILSAATLVLRLASR